MTPSIFDSQVGRDSLIAILINRLGGSVVITQIEFDAISHTYILEDQDEFRLRLTTKEKPHGPG